MRPGKPLVTGRIGDTILLGLPGNPFSALVTFLLFGRALLAGLGGMAAERPRGIAAVAFETCTHRAGRSEFAPARVSGFVGDGRPAVSKLGRGGSARLRPLVLADGLVELSPEVGDVAPGEPVIFHPFAAALAP